MPARIVEGQLPYTGGTGIEIDTNKVISLLLREENNLIMVNSDNEVYTDLQLQSGLTPSSDFPVGVTTGKVLQSDGWEKSGLILNWKTTSGDYARWIYATDGKIYFDNGTGTWNQVYYSSEVDNLLLSLRQYVDSELAKKQNGVTSSTAPANPVQGDLWYDTNYDILKVFNGSQWVVTGGGGGTGDVVGPNSSVDGSIAVFDGTTGKIIKDGNISLSTLNNKVDTNTTNIGTNTNDIATINGKIPNAATTSNQLADKAYVNDSINSITAYYITKNAQGDQFATYAELAAATTFYSGGVVRVPTRNDYCIVLDDENHDHACTRYIYQNNQWEFQYIVNETALTQAQLDALNSGITSAKVSTYDGYASTIAGKQDTLVSGTNIKTINNESLLGTGNITVEGGNTKTFYLSGTRDLTNAQAAYDWWSSGKNSIIIFSGVAYFQDSKDSTSAYYYKSCNEYNTQDNKYTLISLPKIKFNISSGTVTSVLSVVGTSMARVLATNVDYSSPYTPLYNGSPATKKYVDSKSTIVSSTAPSSPTEGMVWYDTTNDVLKTYDGSNWNECGAGGGGVEVFDITQYGTNGDWTDIITSCENNNTLTIILDYWEDDNVVETGYVKRLVTEYDDGANSGTGRISAMALFNLNGVGSAVPYPKSNKLVATFNTTTKYCTGITQSYTEFVPTNSGSTGNVLTKTVGGYEWAAPSGGDVVVSSQTGNILTSGMKIWAGLETDYQNLGSYDQNTLYLVIE